MFIVSFHTEKKDILRMACFDSKGGVLEQTKSCCKLSSNRALDLGVYLGVKTCETFSLFC